MARNMSAHMRYRLAAAAFAAAGGAWCLGTMFGHHAMTLLVIGMMNLATSMLLMSLRPPKGAVRDEPRKTRARCSRGRQTTELTIRTLRADPDLAGSVDRTLELTTNAGAQRPRERKNRTWSI